MIKTILAGVRPFSILAVAALVLFMQSCKKSDLQKEETVSTSQIEELRTYLAKSTGLEMNQVSYVAGSNAFRISDDGLVSLSDAQDRLKGSKNTVGTRQRTYDYLVSAGNATTITVYADGTVPADWLSALDQSIANWNSTNSLVYFKRVYATTTTTTGTKGKGRKSSGGSTTTTTPPVYNILVTTLYDSTTNMIARAYYPDYYGNAGKEVDINTYYNYLSSSNKIFALTHEFGHTIGFTHTDGTYGTLVPGTPETDANSVMNSFVLPWNGFTNYDVIAVTTVYPK